MRKILIDANYILFSSYFQSNIKQLSHNGVGTGMAYGTLQKLFYLFCKYRWDSSEVILIWDSRPTWRYDLYPGYKGDRKEDTTVPEPMSVPLQMKITHLLINLFGMQQMKVKGFESDDTICSFAKKECANYEEIVVVGNDHDLFQCLRPNVWIMRLHAGAPEEPYTEKMFIDEYSLMPADYVTVQALGGCSTDKVPGMTGVGADPSKSRVAVKIVQMNNPRNVLMGSPDLKFPDKRAEKVYRKNFDTWQRERDFKLVWMRTDLEYEVMRTPFNEPMIREWFEKLGFQHFLLPAHYNRMLQVLGGQNA